jgi:hypothetical protein
MKKILLLLIFLNSIKFVSYATTTSGTTNRNINVSDGLIIAGSANGSNNSSWELDEVFPGFQGIVNWYLTWDDNNLYIGRLGGNNLEGSISIAERTAKKLLPIYLSLLSKVTIIEKTRKN